MHAEAQTFTLTTALSPQTEPLRLEDLENRIINADCMDILRRLPDKCVDLVLTDPPYYNGLEMTTYYGKKDKSDTGVKRTKYKPFAEKWFVPDNDWFEQIRRISKEQIIFGINYYEFSGMVKGRLIWDKMNDTSSFSKAEIASCSSIQSVQIYRFLWNGMLQQDMKNKEVRIHPTQKPVDLIGQILRDYSKENDLVLDCFSGSGTTAIACHRLNRRFICIEKDKEYFDMSVKRLDDERKQLSLFGGNE